MSDLILARLLGENDQPLPLNAKYVVDPETGEDVSKFIGRMDEFKGMVDAFLTGEDNANDVIDRLSEIVAAIKANKDLLNTVINGSLKPEDIINDLTTGGVDKVLSAEQGKALKALYYEIHVFANADVLDKIGENKDGELTFDGKPVQGQTGIAFVSTPDETATYTGKIKIVLEKVADTESSGENSENGEELSNPE